MFTLPNLPYQTNELEPFLSKYQVEVHYYKHHQGYVTKLNEILAKNIIKFDTLEELIIWSSQSPIKGNVLFNTAAQVYNHNFFWLSMKPPISRGAASLALTYAIEQSFINVGNLMNLFIHKAKEHFGSGWIWLLVKEDNKIQIETTQDAHTPIERGFHPLLCCDLWEHSYYLDYENDKEKYITNFICNLVNWEFASQNFELRGKQI